MGTRHPQFFLNIASKGFRYFVSGLESVFADVSANADSKEFTPQPDRARQRGACKSRKTGVAPFRAVSGNKKTPARSWRFRFRSQHYLVRILTRKEVCVNEKMGWEECIHEFCQFGSI